MTTDLIKVGEVTQINPGACTARVVFDDEDSLVSWDLPVLQRNTIENRDYWMPDIGEDVLVLFRGGGEEEGFIVGGFYAGEVTPPESTNDKRTIVFSDGTRVSYDRSSHQLTAEIGLTKVVADQGKVTAQAPEEITAEAKTVNIYGMSAVNISAPVLTLTMAGTKMVLKSGSATIEATSLTFKGSMEVTGSISATGNISASGSISGSNI